jgi:pimeloyl-[acyl-carrier protein] methyl ester esterase
MSRAAPEVLFLPGFDGVAELRAAFLAELGRDHAVRGVSYPNRPLHTLDGYCRFAAGQRAPDARTVLVAESFSGLVAARWASNDPQVEAIVLCGSFARNPMTWVTSLGASLPGVVRFGANFLGPAPLRSGDPVGRGWSKSLWEAVRSLDERVIGERLRLIAGEDVRAELAALTIPIVLLQFEDDLVIGPRSRGELEKVCHNAHIVRFPGPHFAIETMPRESAQAIGARIRALAATRT